MRILKKTLFVITTITLLIVGCSNVDMPDQTTTGSESPSTHTSPNDFIVTTNTQATSNIEPHTTHAPVSSTTKEVDQLFEGKIAIINHSLLKNYDEFLAAEMVVRKYGAEKVIHLDPNDRPSEGQELYYDFVNEVGLDPEVKAIIVYQAVPGVNKYFSKLKKQREDIFIVFVTFQDNLETVQESADLILGIDEVGMGPSMVYQAKNLGASTFVHYSSPREQSHHDLSTRQKLIKETCQTLDIDFVEVTDTELDSSHYGLQTIEYLVNDVPIKVAQYGKDTAFFSTNCFLQSTLIEAVVKTGAIYLQPCHPDPYHGFIAALDLEFHYIGINPYNQKIVPASNVVEIIREALKEREMLGRISTWPESPCLTFTAVSAEYAIKWINGEVPKSGVDTEVLKQLMENFTGVEVSLTPFVDDYHPYEPDAPPETYDNYLLMRMDYITF